MAAVRFSLFSFLCFRVGKTFAILALRYLRFQKRFLVLMGQELAFLWQARHSSLRLSIPRLLLRLLPIARHVCALACGFRSL